MLVGGSSGAGAGKGVTGGNIGGLATESASKSSSGLLGVTDSMRGDGACDKACASPTGWGVGQKARPYLAGGLGVIKSEREGKRGTTPGITPSGLMGSLGFLILAGVGASSFSFRRLPMVGGNMASWVSTFQLGDLKQAEIGV